MNRFIQIGKYNVLGLSNDIVELLDTKTGIVYMHTTRGEGLNTLSPMLFDNGKPLHYNKEEVDKVKEMLTAIGEDRYKDICSGSFVSCDLTNTNVVRYFASRDWHIEDVYAKIKKVKKSDPQPEDEE